MGANITVVGGGSYHWAPRLLADFANTPSLTDAHVVLHDLDAERMMLMQELGEQIAQRRGIAMKVESEGDRRRALDGADFVITAFSVGGLRLDATRHRDPAEVRHPPADRRQCRSGRHPARAAQRAGVARHRARRRSGRARRVVGQRDEPAHRAVPVGDARDEREDRRALQRVGRLLVDPQPVVRLRHGRHRSDPRRRQPLSARHVAARRRRRRRLRAAARAPRRSRTLPRPSRSGWIRPSARAGSRSRPRSTGRSST